MTHVQIVERPLEETFAFFADPNNLGQITPPWLSFEIVEAPDPLAAGASIRYRLTLLGVRFSWRSEITAWEPPRSFTDVQRSGPYAVWEHTHRLTPLGRSTEMFDHVVYRPRGGPAAPLICTLFVRRQLDAIFNYRSERISEILDG